EKRSELLAVLSILSTTPGTFALTSHLRQFKNLTQAEREAVFLGWKDSYIPQIRNLYKALVTVSVYTIYAAQESALHNLIGYKIPTKEEEKAKYLDPVPERLKMLTLEELKQSLHYDAIVVGSGAGGGVVAGELAKSGKSVLVIEKGRYIHEEDMIQKEDTGYANMYETGGAFTSLSGSMNIFAGSVFGGGTTVNWSACLKLQHFVREDWARQGLTHFTSPKFSNDLDRVFERIGATAKGINHNGPNQILLDGASKLGYHHADIPQNTGGRAHDCAFCFTGCKAGVKNGTMNTWLRDAADNNARFISQTKVLRVLTEKGKVTGVECLVNNREVVKVYANTVVVSAGSLQTPGVLLRSGLTNKNIGQNLRLHPCSIVYGFFDHNVDMHSGSIMTAVSNVAENVDGEGYGVKLEVPLTHIPSFATIQVWRGAAAHKEAMLKYRQASPIIVITRDKDPNSKVRYDGNDNMIIDYDVSDHDKISIVEGIIHACKITVAAGARSVSVIMFAVEPFEFADDEESRTDNPRFVKWLARVKKNGLPRYGSGIFSAHQMSTCRMGISPSVSVTKPTGETWEIKNLYVADASLFPTASGVNPMVTTEAVALHVA
ncbi:GMC oxidoreductase, partial [Phycomyces blakesleeanus NRRL 1555(-)]